MCLTPYREGSIVCPVDEQVGDVQGDGGGIRVRRVVTETIILQRGKEVNVSVVNVSVVNVLVCVHPHLQVDVCVPDADLHREDLGGGVILQEVSQVP